jgi:hypothetical protein
MAAVKSIDSVFEFATSLQQSLLYQDQPKKDISAYLDVLPLSRKHLSSSDQAKLEKQGVALWNICGKLRQAGQLLAQKDLLSQGIIYHPKRHPYLLLLARAFAYLLLESASEADSRSLKNALRVARECLGMCRVRCLRWTLMDGRCQTSRTRSEDSRTSSATSGDSG